MPGVGDKLGRYTLLKRLAVGGMGEVFVAAKTGPMGFGPFVALKVLRDDLAVDPQFVDMIVDEANITKHLNHQNLVSVLDLGEDNGSYYIAMEFVQGVTAERLIESLVERHRLLDIPLAVHVGVELCRALKYAHSRVNSSGEPLGIIHRDVTPANILISTEGEVKLTDFGIARAKGRIHQTQAGVLKGKFGYMAPEMVRYEAIDARADLFCAGVALYLLAAGRHPVAHASVMEAIQRYENKQIPRPSESNPHITPDLDAVLLKALEPRPEARWQSAAEFGEALQSILLNHPEWRSRTRDPATLLARRVREVAPEVFGEVVPRETMARLSSEASFPALFGDVSAPDARNSGRGSVFGRDGSGLDAETEDGLPYDEVRQARQRLSSDPAPGPLLFPESSTDPNRLSAAGAYDARIDEPELPGGRVPGFPAQPSSDPLLEGLGRERTLAGYEWSEPSIDRTLAETSEDDGETVVGVSMDAVEGAPGAGTLERETELPGPPTVIPVNDSIGGDEGGTIDLKAPPQPKTLLGGSPDPWSPNADPGATLLDGLNADAVRAALSSPDRPEPTLAEGGASASEHDATYVRPLSDPAEPLLSAREPGPAAVEGPIRIVLGADGAPSLAPRTASVGAPLPLAEGLSDGRPGSSGLDVGTETGGGMGAAPEPQTLGWGDEPAARSGVAQGGGTPDPSGFASGLHGDGAVPAVLAGDTGRSSAVAWPPAKGRDGSPLDPWQDGSPGFLARQGPLLAVFGVTCLLCASFGYVWFFTELLWPKLRLETLPPGAEVLIDGTRREGRTPLMVSVAPGRRHRIELRAEGYRPALREITEGIGRGRTYALEVALQRKPPVLDIGPVGGRVLLNGKEVGKGRRVRLRRLPREGQVRIRIEAYGYEPYELIFESADKIPPSLDIPLEEVRDR